MQQKMIWTPKWNQGTKLSFFYHSKHSHQLALQRHQAEGPRLVVGEEQPGRNLLDDLTHLATSEDHLTGGTIIGLVTLWSFNLI